MDDATISWEDILEIGQGGPGCGILRIGGQRPRGNFRYHPPALEHRGELYALAVVPGGFVFHAIDPASLRVREVTPRLPYARLKAVEAGELVYFARLDGSEEARIAITPKRGLFERLTARLARRPDI